MNIETSQTVNGALNYASTMSANLDLFSKIGSARGIDLTEAFQEAFKEDPDLAVRQVLWVRDIRGGAGERNTARKLLLAIEKDYEHVLARIIEKLPTWGRWDDLLIFKKTKFRMMAFNLIKKTLLEGQARMNAGEQPTMEQALCAKWMPREKSNSKEKSLMAHHLKKHMKLDSKSYRQLLSSLTEVVEQKMCAKEFGSIAYDKVPSKASLRYSEAFNRHDGGRYVEYLFEAAEGAKKMNAGAVLPHEVALGAISGSKIREIQAEVQWKNLPNYMTSGKNILVMVDLSGSMDALMFGQKYSFKHVAISLAVYCAQKNTGKMKGRFMSFAEEPTLGGFNPEGSLKDSYMAVLNSQLGYSTNFDAAFDLLLETAKKEGWFIQGDMPEYILVPSDMQFNEASGNRQTNFEAIKEKFKVAGYKMPTLVFWNMDGDRDGHPVHAKSEGAILISGYSPSIMKNILSGDSEAEQASEGIRSSVNPMDSMLKTLMVERYDWQDL